MPFDIWRTSRSDITGSSPEVISEVVQLRCTGLSPGRKARSQAGTQARTLEDRTVTKRGSNPRRQTRGVHGNTSGLP